MDDKREAFQLKVYANPANFPKAYVEKGILDSVEKRVQWIVNQKIKYYYDSDTESNENGECILEAVILEICKYRF